MTAITLLGDVLTKLHRSAEALARFREALSVIEPLASADPANAQYRSDLALLQQRIASAQADLGQADEALPVLKKALATAEPELARDPSSVLLRARVALCEEGMAKVHAVFAARAHGGAEQSREWRESRSWYQKAHDIWLALRQQGATTGDDAAKPDDLAREISRCDQALAKLPPAR